MLPRDQLDRPLRSVRISVTDRCDLRCIYCMPEANYAWVPREKILSFEELSTLVQIFVRLGATDLHLTGGEPLLRQDLDQLVHRLVAMPGVNDLALTTNGVLLAEHTAALRAAGLKRLTVSLDTLRPQRFQLLTRHDALTRVLHGVEAAHAAGFAPLKLNTVVIRGFNDDELVDLLEFGRGIGAEVRFIEYMDVGGATRWSPDQVVPQDEILRQLAAHYGPIETSAVVASAPARRYILPDGLTFGIIPSVTAPFCRLCERSRLTADGWWFPCLYAEDGLDLRSRLRAGASPEELAQWLAAAWGNRADRGAETRLALVQRGPHLSAECLQANPHQEMHMRGG